MAILKKLSVILLAVASFAGAAFAVPQGQGPIFSQTPNAYAVPFSTVDPATQLRQAVAKAQSGQPVTLCFVGDSTMTFPTLSSGASILSSGSGNPNTSSPAGVNRNDGVQYQIIEEIQRQNPGVVFNVYNFGIPGTSLSDYNLNKQTQAQNFGLTWYGSPALWWQFPGNTVPNGGCDITFMGWGLNDNSFLAANQIVVAMNLNYGFASKTGTIWVTPPSANPSAGPPFNTPAWQSGFVSAGSMIRAMTQIGAGAAASGFIVNGPVQPMGVIDIGRWFQSAVLGVDYTDQITSTALSSLYQNPVNITVNTSFTGSMLNGVLTASVNTLATGEQITGYALGVPAGTFITGTTTGCGGTGCYTVNSNATVPSGAMVAGAIDLPPTDGNFEMDFSAGTWANYPTGSVLTISIGATDGADFGTPRFILTKVNSTQIQVVFSNTSALTTPAYVLNFTAPTNWTVSLTCNDIFCSVSSNGSTWAQSFVRPVGPFIPTIQGGNQWPANSSVTFTGYSISKARRFNPTLSMSDAYGQGTAFSAQLNGVAASGQNQLTFSPTAIPSQWANAQTITDLTQQGAIPALSTITNINRSTGVVTISNNLASATGASDVISAGTCAPATGGNCINHLSSYGLQDVNKSVIRNVNFHLLTPAVNGVIAPTKTDGTGAGTGPTTVLTGNDEAFNLSVTTGSSPAASSAIDTITWNVPYTPGGVATAPTCGALVPTNANAQALTGASAPTTSVSSTAYVLTSGSTPLSATTTYTWSVRCPRP